MAKPYKLHEPAGTNVNAPAPRPKYDMAQAAPDAESRKHTLTEVAAENMQPDGDIGGMASNVGGMPGERQETIPAIKWPPAPGVSKKPFKV